MANFTILNSGLSDKEHNFFCQKPSVPGSKPPPDYPSPPINEQCEPNWTFVPYSGTCVYADVAARAWQSASDNCMGLGGDLVSVNAPDKNEQLLAIFIGSALSADRHYLPRILNCRHN